MPAFLSGQLFIIFDPLFVFRDFFYLEF